ncbi:MAG: GNAT family N-acetyltransferase [Alphaproteobacteria bacterium]|nr:GNAT family N-acetyltransferase [Alphaproteobacteria bacterium]
MRQKPVNDTDWAQCLEPPSLLTWPARQMVPLSGWLLRFTGGLSHRANSVATPDFQGDDAGEAVAQVERAYRARGLAPMFQVTSGTKPAGLSDLLAARGYAVVSPSLVWTADVDTVRRRCEAAAETQTLDEANDGFDALVISGSHSPADGRERLEILSRIAVPHVRITVVVQGTAVACGMAALAGGRVGINLMRTASPFRRHGYAKHVLRAIADWSHAHGASDVFLSVEEANAPARALYESAGFTHAYAYRYYRRD